MLCVSSRVYLGVVLCLAFPTFLVAVGGPHLMHSKQLDRKTNPEEVDMSDLVREYKKLESRQSAIQTPAQYKPTVEKRSSPTWFLKNLGTKHMGEEEKRAPSPMGVITFPCSRKNAFCKNGGRGPKLTKTSRGVLCACMCPYGYRQANCQKEWWIE